MTEQEQIKALAELDGYKLEFTSPEGVPVLCWYEKGRLIRECSLDSPRIQSYLTNYDTIIPLIQKQSANVQDKFMMLCVGGISNYTPSQLCESLLKATGKWKN
jgi:serine/threonine protein phosphatase PrpC